MEINKKHKIFTSYFLILLFNIGIIQFATSDVSVPSRKVISEFNAVDSEESLIGQIFFRFQVQYVWAYPNVSSNIIFIYVRPLGSVGTSSRDNSIFNLSESISAQKDFSGIIDKIEYEGSIHDGGFVIIHLNGNYSHSVHQGDKFESIAVIIHKEIPEGSIDSEKLELIKEKK